MTGVGLGEKGSSTYRKRMSFVDIPSGVLSVTGSGLN